MKNWDIMGGGIRERAPLVKKWLGSGWKPTPSVPVDLLSGWLYHSQITTEERSGSNLENYLILVELNNTNFDFEDAQPNGEDIRFSLDDHITLIDYWIEKWDKSNESAKIWVNIPSIPASGTKVIYMYYGNSFPPSTANGANTFEFGEDEGGFIDEWTPYEHNPFSVDLTFASVLKVGSVYHAYYSWHYSLIYHATSTDGKNWTDDVANNPVLSNGIGGAWDDRSVLCSWVWKENSVWYMIYHGRSLPDSSAPQAVGLATSVDGINWTKHASNPVFTGTEPWELNDVENWGVIKVDSTYYMWYESSVGCKAAGLQARTLGLATSTDLVNWTRDPNNPIFPCLPSKCCPCCFKRGDYFYLVFRLEGVSNEEIPLYRDTKPTFYSADREFMGVTHFESSDDWGGKGLDTPFVFTDDIYKDTYDGSNNELWMYYSGRKEVVEYFLEGMTIEPDIDAALTRNVTHFTTYGVFDDFEKGVGSWIEDTEYNKGTVTQENNIVKINSYSTKHSTPEAYSIFYYPLNTQVIKRSIEFYVRPARTNTHLNLFATKNAVHKTSDVSAHIVFGPDGNIKYYDGTWHTIMAYSADTWYRIMLSDIDFPTGTFDIWVDGVKKADKIPFYNGNHLYSFSYLEMELSGAGTNYIDMLLLRKYVSPEPFIFFHPSMLLTETGHNLLQENSSYLRLDRG